MMSDQPGGELMGNREIRAPLVDLLWWAHWEQRTVASPPFRPPPHTLQSFSSSSVPSPSLELSLKHTIQQITTIKTPFIQEMHQEHNLHIRYVDDSQ